MSTRSLPPVSIPHPGRALSTRSTAALTCPIRRPSHRTGAEAPLTWEELLGRR